MSRYDAPSPHFSPRSCGLILSEPGKPECWWAARTGRRRRSLHAPPLGSGPFFDTAASVLTYALRGTVEACTQGRPGEAVKPQQRSGIGLAPTRF